MIWRTLLLPIVVGAAGAAILVAQQPNLTLDVTGHSAEVQYLGQARDLDPALSGTTDATLLRVGRGLCQAIGSVPEKAAEPHPVDGLTEASTRAMTDAATQHLCPAQRAKVSGYLRAQR
ncbi:DUF732 domain-containing protein [Spirillospora sp. CA-294931]|uniref:DUF732 domain-containing protein n=1 Tax=Spirillospora sp. CA-294931 TaxID=3240042 RepID=UPI003D8A59BF